MASQLEDSASTQNWERSDKYHNSFLIPKDDVLDAVVKKNVEQELPNIAVSKAQGKFLHLVAKSIGAKKILEIGTLGGYSTIWLARALPTDGKLITLELSSHYAEIALENLKAAGVDNKVTIVIGPAAESLKKLSPELEDLYDLVFIDADKPSNPIYFSEAKRLVRKGGLIIVDNVVRCGLVADPEYTDEKIEGVRRMLKAMEGDEEIEATTIATVGDKGHDGFIYAIKK